MTIREVENSTDLDRSSIRFYESEGLISPKREANGYRTYSENNVAVLKKIKLLRALGLSLDEIRDISGRKISLTSALQKSLIDNRERREDLEHSSGVIMALLRDNVSFDSLDTDKYSLNTLPSEKKLPSYIKQDNGKKMVWRRVLARCFDFFSFWLLWQLILQFPLNTNIEYYGAFLHGFEYLTDGIVPFLIMLIIEPVLIALFGTTPGKWLMGLSIVTPEGKRLTYKEALSRTFYLFFFGFCCGITIIMIIAAYLREKNKDEGRWEWDSRVVSVPHRRLRYVLYGVFAALLLAADFLAPLAAALPPNHGELSVAEFAENYNNTAKYHYLDQSNCYELHNSGKWVLSPDFDPTEAISVIQKSAYLNPMPDLEYGISDDGAVSLVKFSCSTSDPRTVYLHTYQEILRCAALSLVGADMDIFEYPKFESELYELTSDTEFDFTYGDYRFICDTTFSGYEGDGILEPSGEDRQFEFEFIICERGANL